ncbi:MAG TPA: Lrp/AsnC family transcriptional regulator [Candidatus Deferrimicrobium sp.]|nr:Lrp/AsnC family transcriptional regulator [Candidatus Deferrimicrobium sp.]
MAKKDIGFDGYYSEDYLPDEIDRRIIRCLSEDGRASYSQIATNLGVTAATVRNRISRLVDFGIIKNFKPLINKKFYKLDISAFLMITLDSSKVTEEIIAKLQDFSEISQIAILTSNPNIVCTVFAQNMDLFSILLSKVTQLDGIKDVKTNFILKSVASGFFIQ